MLPTPMATWQAESALTLRVYDPEGRQVAEHRLGRHGRKSQPALALDDILGNRIAALPEGYGHLELGYDFDGGAEGDGWTNSYLGKPPGLSTRLYLRLVDRPGRVMCHLTYPTSGQWRRTSDTNLILYAPDGAELARRHIAIPCSGSRLVDPAALFDAAVLQAAKGGYIIIRDTTCRLFGYHLFDGAKGGFALDHMFGF
jgi:hypothetical protein